MVIQPMAFSVDRREHYLPQSMVVIKAPTMPRDEGGDGATATGGEPVVPKPTVAIPLTEAPPKRANIATTAALVASSNIRAENDDSTCTWDISVGGKFS